MFCFRNHISIQLTTDIIQAIQPLLALVPPSKGNEAIMSPDDQLYLFEVVGVVIISGEHSVEVSAFLRLRNVEFLYYDNFLLD